MAMIAKRVSPNASANKNLDGVRCGTGVFGRVLPGHRIATNAAASCLGIAKSRALARRGMQNEIVGFDSIGGDADSIIRAVANRRVDTAIVWGAFAGYFARKFGNRLHLTVVTPEIDPPALPLTFTISMGVRKGNTALRDELESFLLRRRSEIHTILDQYGVPQLALPQSAGGTN